VIRHRDRRDARVDRTLGLVDPVDALHHEVPVPLFTQPRHVGPGGRRCLHPVDVGIEETGHGVVADRVVRHTERGETPRERPLEGPARADDSLVEVPREDSEVHLLGDVGTAPVAGGVERPVEGEDDPDGAGGLGPLESGDHRVLVAGPIDLEERLAVRLDDLLDRLAGERAETHRDATSCGSGSNRHLGAGVDGLDAGGRDHHRHR